MVRQVDNPADRNSPTLCKCIQLAYWPIVQYYICTSVFPPLTFASSARPAHILCGGGLANQKDAFA